METLEIEKKMKTLEMDLSYSGRDLGGEIELTDVRNPFIRDIIERETVRKKDCREVCYNDTVWHQRPKEYDKK